MQDKFMAQLDFKGLDQPHHKNAKDNIHSAGGSKPKKKKSTK